MAYDKVIDSAKLDAALTETANAIRGKAGGTELINFDETQGFKSAVESIETGGGYDQGYEDGKNSVVQFDRCTTAFLPPTLNVFGEKEVELNLDYVTDLSNFCNLQGAGEEKSNITVEHLTINCPNQITSMNNTLYAGDPRAGEFYDETLKRVTFNVYTQSVKIFSGSFSGCVALEIVDGVPFNFSSCEDYSVDIFKNCESLTSFRVVPNTISVEFPISYSRDLDSATVKSIIAGLANLVGQRKQYLWLASNITANLTDEQITEITNKNWEVF